MITKPFPSKGLAFHFFFELEIIFGKPASGCLFFYCTWRSLFLLLTLFASPTVGPCTVERTNKNHSSFACFVCLFWRKPSPSVFLTLCLKGTPKYCRICSLGKQLQSFLGKIFTQFDDCAYFFRWVGNSTPTPKNSQKEPLRDNQKQRLTLLGTNISPNNGILKMIFLFPRWDMLIPWRVPPNSRAQCNQVHP